ncbi:MAG: hypothetical protein GKR99_05175 [Rhodobacteraceae bacterium]|nr:hypothetical protein [Paracoccaceae bacterium]
MFAPDDPLAPAAPVFAEPWHAQVLAMADTLIVAGHIDATDWADALGAALRHRADQPDTPDTYYAAALAALERLATSVGIGPHEQADRKAAWEAAYMRTPHGSPVAL